MGISRMSRSIKEFSICAENDRLDFQLRFKMSEIHKPQIIDMHFFSNVSVKESTVRPIYF